MLVSLCGKKEFMEIIDQCIVLCYFLTQTTNRNESEVSITTLTTKLLSCKSKPEEIDLEIELSTNNKIYSERTTYNWKLCLCLTSIYT